MPEFEFDAEKSKSNFEKHGIDFETAKDLWNDPDAIEIQVRTEDEPRFLVIGCLSTKHWSAIITYRGNRIRLISVRRSRRKEVELY